MKKQSLWFLIVSVMMASTIVVSVAHADDDPYDLSKLDAFGSCVTQQQKENGEKALSFLKAFSWWNMKDQMAMIGPDYFAWHSSIAGLLFLRPEYRAALPFFQNGGWDHDHYIRAMAFLAAHNDTSLYKVIPYRVDCAGTDAVTLLTKFTGLQIRRDPTTGCVTHGVPFGSPTNIQVEFKDYVLTEGQPAQRLIYRTFSNLDDEASVRVREELARVVQGPSNVPPNPGNCKTEAQIYQEFQDQLNLTGDDYPNP